MNIICEEKKYDVSLEYQNPIGMPVVIRRHLSESEISELTRGNYVKILRKKVRAK